MSSIGSGGTVASYAIGWVGETGASYNLGWVREIEASSKNWEGEIRASSDKGGGGGTGLVLTRGGCYYSSSLS